jgi:hypothetical protein
MVMSSQVDESGNGFRIAIEIALEARCRRGE